MDWFGCKTTRGVHFLTRLGVYGVWRTRGVSEEQIVETDLEGRVLWLVVHHEGDHGGLVGELCTQDFALDGSGRSGH